MVSPNLVVLVEVVVLVVVVERGWEALYLGCEQIIPCGPPILETWWVRHIRRFEGFVTFQSHGSISSIFPQFCLVLLKCVFHPLDPIVASFSPLKGYFPRFQLQFWTEGPDLASSLWLLHRKSWGFVPPWRLLPVGPSRCDMRSFKVV